MFDTDLIRICRSLSRVGKFKIIRCVAVILVCIIVISIHGKVFNGEQNGIKVKDGEIAERAEKLVISNFSGIQENKLLSVKILCYILLSRSRVKTAIIIKETWGSHCDELLFFGGYEYPQLPVTFLNVTEGYENLWGKAKAAIVYLFNKPRFKKFDYFLKVDHDTFVIVENLRKFLNNNSILLSNPVWFGFKLKHRRMLQGYMSGGAGYVFNKAALNRLGQFLTKQRSHFPFDGGIDLSDCNVDAEYGVEDLELGKCFLSAGVTSIDTTDENGRERFLPLSYEVFLNGAISSFHWIWSQAWNRVKTGEKCCSPELITMHEVSPSQMKTMYYLLYKIRH